MDEKGATFVCDMLAAGAEPAPSAASPSYLIVLSGGIPGAMLRLSAGNNPLGRAADSALQLLEVTISRRHAALRVDGDGLVWLTDLNSSNGTYRNGQRLAANCPVALRDGDRLRFGREVVVKFVRPDPCEEQFQREMFERTVRDPLTGLHNRAYFQDQLGPLAQRAAGRNLGLAIAMLDIDHFKRVNDTHGHAAGDAVLREVAAVIRRSIRPDDLLARFGGEEFVAALPIAAPEQAVARAERIRRALAARRIALAGGQTLRVTASLGLIFCPPGRPRTAASLIMAADRCLYRAKRDGRDRVVFDPHATGPTPEAQLTTDGECPIPEDGDAALVTFEGQTPLAGPLAS
jgi:two-component system, cell cycle response regulator